MAFVNELKTRLDCYFRIVVRNIRDTVPRLIGHFLVRVVQNKMQIELFRRLNQMFETVNRSMGEPAAVVQERKALTIQLDTLRKADRVLTRDPEITTMISTSDDELLIELRQEKAEEEDGKKVDQNAIIEKCMKSVLPASKQVSAPTTSSMPGQKTVQKPPAKEIQREPVKDMPVVNPTGSPPKITSTVNPPKPGAPVGTTPTGPAKPNLFGPPAKTNLFPDSAKQG